MSHLLLLVLVVVLLLLNLPPTTATATAHSTTDYLKLPLRHVKSKPFIASSHSHRRRSPRRGSQTLKSPIFSGASSGTGQYFVDLRLGTPPQRTLLVADTGSDLVWVRCSACRNCSHHRPSSFYRFRHSSTFSPRHCFSPACRLVPHSKTRHLRCNRTLLHSSCWYEYGYGDGSITSGIFSTEAASFESGSGGVKTVHALAFGCGFNVSGPSLTGPSFNGANGVMGLGRGPISFSAQLGHRFGNKFSYCLLDYTLARPPPSYLLIGGGDDGVFKNYSASSTPLLTNHLSPTFYYIGIESVAIDDTKLPIDPAVWALDDLGNGGTVVDTGTTLSSFPEPAYRLILAEFRARVGLPQLEEPTSGFDLCLNVSAASAAESKLPRMRLVLEGGAVFDPPAGNYFIFTADGVKCLAVQPVKSPSGFGVIGNLMQQGFLLEFDNDRSRLRFSREACALHH
ncbi:hypothetical protein Dimus_031176 [Dionaea muscipula]